MCLQTLPRNKNVRKNAKPVTKRRNEEPGLQSRLAALKTRFQCVLRPDCLLRKQHQLESPLSILCNRDLAEMDTGWSG
jgi:hypothetical protein